MNDALDLIYYTLNKFLNFMFSAYIFDGVSIGMVLLVVCIFLIMLRYVVAIPRIKYGGIHEKFKIDHNDSSDSSGASS